MGTVLSGQCQEATYPADPGPGEAGEKTRCGPWPVGGKPKVTARFSERDAGLPGT